MGSILVLLKGKDTGFLNNLKDEYFEDPFNKNTDRSKKNKHRTCA